MKKSFAVLLSITLLSLCTIKVEAKEIKKSFKEKFSMETVLPKREGKIKKTFAIPEVKDLNTDLTYDQFLTTISKSGFIIKTGDNNYFVSDFKGNNPAPFYPDKFFNTFSYKDVNGVDVINKVIVDWIDIYFDVYIQNENLTDDGFANKLLEMFMSYDFMYEYGTNYSEFLWYNDVEDLYQDHRLNGDYHLMLEYEDFFVPLNKKNITKTYAANFVLIHNEEEFNSLMDSGLNYFVKYTGIIKKAYIADPYYVLLVETNGIKTYVSTPKFDTPIKVGDEITVYGISTFEVPPANNRISILSLGWFK